MIPPYPGPQSFFIGPLQFQVFGTLVATGVLVGHWMVLRLAAERRVSMAEIRGAAAWALGAGFVGAHVADVLIYKPEKLGEYGPFVLLMVWDGISSYGGFFGALAGVAFYFRRRRQSWWQHADLLVQGLVVGWIFGRLGCTLTSDHMGRLSDFPLAFAYEAGARHNLGFYELVFTLFVLVPAVLALRARERSAGYRPGIYVAVVSALYAPARFLLDFLRATDLPDADPRYLGLTGGQYASVLLLGLAIWWSLKNRGQAPNRHAE